MAASRYTMEADRPKRLVTESDFVFACSDVPPVGAAANAQAREPLDLIGVLPNRHRSIHCNLPRPKIGQTHSTVPLRTPTITSCR